jgi:NADPH-dependent FMN reductase
MTSYRVGYFVGSLSSTSINRELSKALIRVAPDELEFDEIPIGNLPLYSPEFDADYPPEAVALKEAIHRSDAVSSSLRNTIAQSRVPGRTRLTGHRDRGVRTPLTRSPQR